MTKSIPPYEKRLHEAFAKTYAALAELKNNRNKYMSSAQVYVIYDRFLQDVHELSLTRKDEELKGMSLNLPNPVDLLIDDIWHLLSLSFMTCGLTQSAPATYLSLLTVYKLLTHLRECQVYSDDDLRPIKGRLLEIEQIIARLGADDAETDSLGPAFLEETLLLRNKLAKCFQVYLEIEATFKQIPSDLEAPYAKLIAIRKALFALVTSDAPLAADIRAQSAHLSACLKAVEAGRDSLGKFPSAEASGARLAAAQMVLDGLLDDCNNLLYDLNIQHDNDILSRFELLSVEDLQASEILSTLKLLYDELLSIKQTLDNLLVTRRWTMRETDLYTYQKSLKAIDERRVGANEKISAYDGSALKRMKKAQLLVLYLLRRCYALVYKLLESSEPVSESLQPIHNQLSTVRRCLLEIKRVDGLNNLRELFPFQFKLASLDNLRHDGKFIVNNQVPEGQGTLNALLAECFDILYELKIELEEKEENEDPDDAECCRNAGNITDEEDKGSDDEVELKRNRYMGFNEADYDVVSESELSGISDSEFESNDYY
ncbi:hypothetical protein METBIDRAFT_41298 [Metschnikowia bicuspidata var. bicuspidata NRRL YB-4993]|uniref:Uncharacterized protein n=1 Tax=Metschnikowia bicuspidata var. bicuspidata NRRL YB-4993 TaxID=869754 RepID=A0A1A0HBL9_9ASCO|nr:hypothetical protein METBIDRAFT_41298 [Metschnikowia bicuspidata var. bicuspidata NRRL YB-4993]OBA21272.1 hypothetical protein METBIDRAFT_41298 [Metschnikowia bicuspidata var. bicuspidata NRRL YB-4993]